MSFSALDWRVQSALCIMGKKDEAVIYENLPQLNQIELVIKQLGEYKLSCQGKGTKQVCDICIESLRKLVVDKIKENVKERKALEIVMRLFPALKSDEHANAPPLKITVDHSSNS